MKPIFTKLLLLLLIFSLAEISYAQSLKWAGTNKEYARKIGDNLYEPIPAGVLSFRYDNGQFWKLFNGASESDKPVGYSRKDGRNKIIYFNSEDQIIGYLIPSEKRYYKVEPLSGKEDQYALLYDGILYIDNGVARFNVDDDFPIDILGFFLFVH